MKKKLYITRAIKLIAFGLAVVLSTALLQSFILKRIDNNTMRMEAFYLEKKESLDAVLIGAGKLGQALMGYSGFEDYGLNILAAFDANPKMEETEDGTPVYHVSKLTQFCKANKVLMGIITVPAQHAQAVADQLIAVGIKAIWTFAPTHLDGPPGILVQYENMATSLAVLSVHLQAQIKEEKETKK